MIVKQRTADSLTFRRQLPAWRLPLELSVLALGICFARALSRDRFGADFAPLVLVVSALPLLLVELLRLSYLRALEIDRGAGLLRVRGRLQTAAQVRLQDLSQLAVVGTYVGNHWREVCYLRGPNPPIALPWLDADPRLLAEDAARLLQLPLDDQGTVFTVAELEGRALPPADPGPLPPESGIEQQPDGALVVTSPRSPWLPPQLLLLALVSLPPFGVGVWLAAIGQWEGWLVTGSSLWLVGLVARASLGGRVKTARLALAPGELMLELRTSLGPRRKRFVAATFEAAHVVPAGQRESLLFASQGFERLRAMDQLVVVGRGLAEPVLRWLGQTIERALRSA